MTKRLVRRRHRRYAAFEGALLAGALLLVAGVSFAQDADGEEPPPAEGEATLDAAVVPASGEEAGPPAADESKLDVVTATPPRDHLVLSLDDGRKMTFKVIGVYELHFNVISDDYSAEDWLSFYMLRLDANLTKRHQLSLRMDMEQRYIADPGESGLWFGDMRLYFSRKFSLPIPKFPIPAKASVYVTAPTSRVSQERSYITKPTAALTLVPSYGKFSLVTTGYFRYSIAEYAESSNDGDLNTMLTAGYSLQLIYAPFNWFAPYVVWSNSWDKPYADRDGVAQPWISNYGFEVAADFAIPHNIHAAPDLDIVLAYRQGANMLQDGVYRMYFAKRDQAEVYLGINLVY